MKKTLSLLLIICLLLASCQLSNEPLPNSPETSGQNSNETSFGKIKGIWISCYDHISTANKTENEYFAQVDEMFKKISETGFNTAFVHLRAFSDAFYKSDIFPYSSFIAEYEGAKLDFDPFEIILKAAKKHEISVHGWINPFRISNDSNPDNLSEKNPAKKIIDSGNQNEEICILSNGIYFNPSCTSNHKLITDGVREIISKYKIDGIHIDDYFYPSVDEAVDKKQYEQYVSDGGTLKLGEWRKANVNAFVAGLYSAVKSADPSLIFSISPAAKIEKNYAELYADCKLWLSQKGYADLIIPQIYFGFEHENYPFEVLLKQWGELQRCSETLLACGIAGYKCSSKDDFAGSGSEEWQTYTNILSRQIKEIENNRNYCGFVMYSYRDLNRTACAQEINNLKNAIKD